MKIWTLHTETDDGQTVTPYVDQPAAQTALDAAVRAAWDVYHGNTTPCPDDTTAAYASLIVKAGFFDTVAMREHDLPRVYAVDLSATAPDPKRRTNMDRAAEGLGLADLMHQMTGVDDLRSQVADALCHLMHTCRLIQDDEGNPVSFGDCLASAAINFHAEVEEDPDT